MAKETDAAKLQQAGDRNRSSLAMLASKPARQRDIHRAPEPRARLPSGKD